MGSSFLLVEGDWAEDSDGEVVCEEQEAKVVGAVWVDVLSEVTLEVWVDAVEQVIESYWVAQW